MFTELQNWKTIKFIFVIITQRAVLTVAEANIFLVKTSSEKSYKWLIASQQIVQIVFLELLLEYN